MSDSGRVVIITGGSRGIGRAIAYRFAGEKPKLVLVHYDPDDSAAEQTLAQLAEKGVQGEAHRIDVSNRAEVERLFKEVLARFGRVGVLINNAGITKDGLLMRMSEDEWDLVLKVNLKGVFNCSQAVIRSMVKERSGRIVNITSVAGQIGNAGQTNYAASKAGIMGFTKSLAREVGSRGITVNAVAPPAAIFNSNANFEIARNMTGGYFNGRYWIGGMTPVPLIGAHIFNLCEQTRAAVGI